MPNAAPAKFVEDVVFLKYLKSREALVDLLNTEFGENNWKIKDKEDHCLLRVPRLLTEEEREKIRKAE